MPMATIQDTFFKIQDTKKKQREIRALYREALKQSQSYQDVIEEVRTLREKKKHIEEKIRADYERDLARLYDLVEELKRESEKIADMVMTSLARGEVVKVHDARNIVYDPIVTVRFKKSDDQ